MATWKTYNIKMPNTVYTPSKYSDDTGAYASDIAKARVAYEQAQANKPKAYQSQYTGQMNDIVNILSNRNFSYDVNSDALFQQLKDLYNAQGKLAMANTQGQAAALTGGYGNSYGVAASQQAYQQAQNQLYDRVPELAQLAMSRYQLEGNDLQNLYSILANQDTTDYGRYRDTVTDYENERAYRENALRNLQSMNQSLWSADEANAYNANNMQWNNYWTGEQQTAANRSQAVSEEQWEKEYALQQLAASSGGSGGNGGSGGGTTTQGTGAVEGAKKAAQIASNAVTLQDGSVELGAQGDKKTAAAVKKINNSGRPMEMMFILPQIDKMYDDFEINLAEYNWLRDYYLDRQSVKKS